MNKEEKLELLKENGLEGFDSLNVPQIDQVIGLVEENASLKELNEKLNSQVSEKPAEKAPTIKHDGKTYILTAPRSTFKGKLVTLATLKADKKLLAELIKIKSGILKIQ